MRIRHLPNVCVILSGMCLAAAGASGRDASLSSLQLTGYLMLGDEVQVCIADSVSSDAMWLTVGQQGDGLRATSFDGENEIVVLTLNGATRTVRLKEAKISAVPVARLADGSVDWFHMNLPEKEKEREADLLMWDILEVGRLARLGQLPKQPATSRK